MDKLNEDRILRLWTPLVLRTSVTVSVIILIFGLIAEALYSPEYYVARFHELQRGAALEGQESARDIIANALRLHPHEIITIGLLCLTLVPLGRVVLSLCLFLKERDLPFVALTAYVLTMLIVGIFLGHVG